MGTDKLGKFDLIDLDPFVTCHQQLENVWEHLNDKAMLFVTFGGEYRRSFIKTNRKSICQRYGFVDNKSDNSDYLEEIPAYFLGYVAEKAASNGFVFKVKRAVRYANNCRFWLDIKKCESSHEWRNEQVTKNSKGLQYKNLEIPRFKEVRFEIDSAKKLGFSR